MIKCLAIGGLLAAYVGFGILFRYGMPYRIDTGGSDIIVTEAKPENRAEDDRYRRIGWMGVFFVTAGAAAQIASVTLS